MATPPIRSIHVHVNTLNRLCQERLGSPTGLEKESRRAHAAVLSTAKRSFDGQNVSARLTPKKGLVGPGESGRRNAADRARAIFEALYLEIRVSAETHILLSHRGLSVNMKRSGGAVLTFLRALRLHIRGVKVGRDPWLRGLSIGIRGLSPKPYRGA